MSAKYVKILINGVVQGVGFRPFIYRIGLDLEAKGWVKNTGGNVQIVVNSEIASEFIQRIQSQPPPNCRIDSIKIKTYKPQEMIQEFKILESQTNKTTLESVLPNDVAICPKCLEEIRDSKDRHYQYAFNTCTNCGPRYSIIATLPFDRKNTSMTSFSMCPECQHEYENPADPRFHSQTNSCPKCGVMLEFYDHTNKSSYNQEALQSCIEAIKNGEIVALKGIGGFALVCDARNKITIAKLRERKHRPKKPFALMVKDLKMASKVVMLNKFEIKALTSHVAPIVLCAKKDSNLVSELIAPDIDSLGVILPYSGLHYLLLESLDFPIVFTSANLSGEPIIASIEELREKIGNVFDSVLDYNREILHSIDDSVMSFLAGEMRVIRAARGLTPLILDLNNDLADSRTCIGVGAEQKSSITYASESKYLISPYIGDLDNAISMEKYEKTFEFFEKIYSFSPNALISDLNKNYHSSIWSAKKSSQIRSKHYQVQHHQAHFCAIFAEAMLQNPNIKSDTKVLGFIWDGTGLGNDGKIWGGEVFLGNIFDIERVGYFEDFPLLGGEGAIKKIYKIGYALALKYGADKLIEIYEKKLPKEESIILRTMFEKDIQTIQTSSVGRLFDGIASLCGLIDENSYEGESGMILESLSSKYISEESYHFSIIDNVVDYKEMILEIQTDVLNNQISKIAKKFICTLAQIILAFTKKYSQYCVIFSGGVFQNKVLCTQIKKLFQANGFVFYMPRFLPSNDMCISFGQAVYAQYNYDKI